MDFYGVEQVYSESGVDLTLLRANLDRPVEKRLLDNTRHALALARMQTEKRSWSMNVFEPEALLQRLHGANVRFVLVGGLAMIAHGSTYVTKDLGLCYSRSEENIDRLIESLAPLHPYLRGAPKGLPFVLDEPTVLAGLNFTLTTDLGDLDLLGEISGIGDFSGVDAVSEDRNVFGIQLRILSLDGLIAAKKAARRTKDQLHLLELEELRKLRDRPQADG